MSGETLVYGIHAVSTRLRTPLQSAQLILKSGKLSARLQGVLDVALAAGISVARVDHAALEALVGAGKSHQGVALSFVAAAPAQSLEEVLAAPGDKLLLVLDGVTDPGNLGACLRSAVTLGAAAVIAPRDKSAPLNADAIKRASGGADLVPYIRVTNIARAMKQMREAGIWTVGTVLEAEQRIDQIDLTGSIALVMGSEGSGIRHRTAESCDYLVTIPMQNPALGFNVSVATGICLYEAQRQRSS